MWQSFDINLKVKHLGQKEKTELLWMIRWGKIKLHQKVLLVLSLFYIETKIKNSKTPGGYLYRCFAIHRAK